MSEVEVLEPGPAIEHERPAMDPGQDTSSDGRSELDRHKEARGYSKPASEQPAVSEPEMAESADPVVPEEVKAKPERWVDPDTNDTYDMRHKVARRIKKVLEDRSKVTERAERAERERDDLLRRMADGQRPTPQDTRPVGDAPAAGEPDPNDATKYPDGQFDRAYVRDAARWEAKQEVEARFNTARTEASEHARRRAETAQISQWQATLPEAQKKYADFDAALDRIPNTPENAPIVRLMMGSPVGNDLVYVLGTQPEAMEAYRRAPSADDRLRLLYHLEAQLLHAQRGAAAPQKPSTTRAPLPTSPVHAGAGPNGPIDWSRSDDPDQYARYKAMRKPR